MYNNDKEWVSYRLDNPRYECPVCRNKSLMYKLVLNGSPIPVISRGADCVIEIGVLITCDNKCNLWDFAVILSFMNNEEMQQRVFCNINAVSTVLN